MNTRHLFTTVLLALLIAAPADAQTGAGKGAWFSYRDTYRSMIRFEKYGRPKQFLESRLQVVPKDKEVPQGAMRLTLEGKSTRLDLPLDALGRTVFPLLKTAYDDNAELLINRPQGSVTLVPRVSIAVRADGLYETADLRVACNQILQYLHDIGDNAQDGKHCAGVVFSYLKDGTGTTVNFRGAGRPTSPLPLGEGSPFPGDANSASNYRLAIYRFADWSDKGQIMTDSAPLAIAALFE